MQGHPCAISHLRLITDQDVVFHGAGNVVDAEFQDPPL